MNCCFLLLPGSSSAPWQWCQCPGTAQAPHVLRRASSQHLVQWGSLQLPETPYQALAHGYCLVSSVLLVLNHHSLVSKKSRFADGSFLSRSQTSSPKSILGQDISVASIREVDCCSLCLTILSVGEVGLLGFCLLLIELLPDCLCYKKKELKD